MARAPKPPAPAATSGAEGDSLWVVLPNKSPKKNSVRFETDERGGVPVTNVYLSSEAYKALGNPDKLKITVEAADE